MGQMRLQKKALHVFMVVFFTLMVFYFPRLEAFEDYALYVATVLFTAHMWYGAVFFFETLGPSMRFPELAVDLSILALKVASVFAIFSVPVWFFANGVLMGLCVVKYRLASARKRAEGKEQYIFRKTAIETLSVFAFFLLAILTWVVDTAPFRIALGVAVVGIQIPALCWMLLGGKIYRVSA